MTEQLPAKLRKSPTDPPYELSVFYAEEVWNQLASQSHNALQMEQQLASISDVVIIIVESEGAIAELGAFAFYKRLRRKLLLLLNTKFQKSESFINTGPVRWVDADSVFGPAIFVHFDSILEATDEVVRRFKKIHVPARSYVNELADSPKHLLFLICDLVAMIGPVTQPMIEYYVHRIVDSAAAKLVPSLLGLSVAMKLLRVHT